MKKGAERGTLTEYPQSHLSRCHLQCEDIEERQLTKDHLEQSLTIECSKHYLN